MLAASGSVVVWNGGMLLVGGSANWKTFADLKAQNLGQDKSEYFMAKGTIVFMKKENCMYTVSQKKGTPTLSIVTLKRTNGF